MAINKESILAALTGPELSLDDLTDIQEAAGKQHQQREAVERNDLHCYIDKLDVHEDATFDWMWFSRTYHLSPKLLLQTPSAGNQTIKAILRYFKDKCVTVLTSKPSRPDTKHDRYGTLFFGEHIIAVTDSNCHIRITDNLRRCVSVEVEEDLDIFCEELNQLTTEALPCLA